MAAESTQKRLVVADLSGGRNGADPPLLLNDTQCVDAFNVDWWNASLARKRNGAARLPTPNPPGSPFSGHISFLGRHIPAADETAAMLFGVDDASPNPKIGATQPLSVLFGLVQTIDPITGNGWDVQAQSLKNKYFMAYQSGQPRLHVYDPTLYDLGIIPQQIRRAGLAAPTAAPGAANSGAGAYPAIGRYYRLRLTTQVGGITTRRSEPGPATTLVTPSGAGAGISIVFPAGVVEGETHWEVEASLDATAYFLVATATVGTVSVVDSVLTTNYVNLPLSASTGTYSLQKSYRFVGVDGNRILGWGSFTAADAQNRFEFSAPGGSTNVSDEERVPLGNYIDLDEADSGAPTGLCGPVFGAFYLFKYRQVWKVVRTGIGSQPYVVFPVSKVVGAVNQQCIEIGEDAKGNPAVYFLSVRGPYRLTVSGLEYLGKPNEDLWFGPTSFINLAASKVVAHAVYHGDRRQVWFWLATNAGNDPDTRLIFDVRTGAWSRHGGASCRARCSAMYANVPNTSYYNLKPFCGNTDGIANVFRCDDDQALDDNGETYYAFVQTKPYPLGGLGAYCTVGQGTLTALAGTNVTITVTITRDLGKQIKNASCVLTPQGSETRVQRLLDAASMAGAWAVSFTIGDASPVANRWTLDALTINYTPNEAAV
jgi:hypothetical protein